MPSDGAQIIHALKQSLTAVQDYGRQFLFSNAGYPRLILAPVNQTQMLNTKTDGFGYIGLPAAKTENRRTPQVESATSASEDSDLFASQPSTTVLWQTAFQPRESAATPDQSRPAVKESSDSAGNPARAAAASRAIHFRRHTRHWQR